MHSNVRIRSIVILTVISYILIFCIGLAQANDIKADLEAHIKQIDAYLKTNDVKAEKTVKHIAVTDRGYTDIALFPASGKFKFSGKRSTMSYHHVIQAKLELKGHSPELLFRLEYRGVVSFAKTGKPQQENKFRPGVYHVPLTHKLVNQHSSSQIPQVFLKYGRKKSLKTNEFRFEHLKLHFLDSPNLKLKYRVYYPEEMTGNLPHYEETHSQL